MALGLSTTAFANATAVINIIPILAGLNAILRPTSALSMLGFVAPPEQAQTQKLCRSLLQMYGVRQVAMGLTGLTLWSFAEHRLMGAILFANMPIAIVDGWVVRRQTGGGEWGTLGICARFFGIGGRTSGMGVKPRASGLGS